MENSFKWLGPDSIPRRGPTLISGQTYNVRDFSEDVVKEWVKTGFAEFSGESKKSKKSEVK